MFTFVLLVLLGSTVALPSMNDQKLFTGDLQNLITDLGSMSDLASSIGDVAKTIPVKTTSNIKINEKEKDIILDFMDVIQEAARTILPRHGLSAPNIDVKSLFVASLKLSSGDMSGVGDIMQNLMGNQGRSAYLVADTPPALTVVAETPEVRRAAEAFRRAYDAQLRAVGH